MRRLLSRVTLCMSLSLALGACATGDGMQEKLRDATRGYNGAIRWGDVDRAAGYLPQESVDAFLQRMDQSAEKLVIVDYQVTRLDLDKKAGVAASRAEILWHTDRRLVVETTHVDHLWQFHDGRFVLVDERRSGGTPLGVFAEVGDTDHPWLPGLKIYRETHEIGEDNKKKKKRRGKRRGRDSDATATDRTAATNTVR